MRAHKRGSRPRSPPAIPRSLSLFRQGGFGSRLQAKAGPTKAETASPSSHGAEARGTHPEAAEGQCAMNGVGAAPEIGNLAIERRRSQTNARTVT